jgi:hypothetical protein
MAEWNEPRVQEHEGQDWSIKQNGESTRLLMRQMFVESFASVHNTSDDCAQFLIELARERRDRHPSDFCEFQWNRPRLGQRPGSESRTEHLPRVRSDLSGLTLGKGIPAKETKPGTMAPKSALWPPRPSGNDQSGVTFVGGWTERFRARHVRYRP